MTDHPSGASREAIEAANHGIVASARRRGFRGNDSEAWSLHSDARAALAAAHDPALGDARSVCLRDVLAFVDARVKKCWSPARANELMALKVEILREFGGHDGD